MINLEMTDADNDFISKQNLTLPLNTAQLKRFLPHRYPFVFVDRVTQLCVTTDDKSIVGYKHISHSEPCFQGHFPENPIFPGVYIVEAMAQIAGILGFVADETDLLAGSMYLFAGVDKVRFKGQVGPGDTLYLKADALKVRRNLYTYTAKAYVNDKIVASAEIMLVKQAIEK